MPRLGGANAPLNPRQRRFIDEYLKDLNATAAVIRAGYSANGASVQGHLLLRHPKVSEEIAKRQKKMADKYEITREKVIRELAKIGFANIGDFFKTTTAGDPIIDIAAADRDQLASLQEITVDDYVDGRGDNARDVKRVRIRLLDKQAALVNLGKHLGLFKDTSPDSEGGAGTTVVIKGGLPEGAKVTVEVPTPTPASSAPSAPTDKPTEDKT